LKSKTPRVAAIFRALRDRQVEFVVVGGVAAVLAGAPFNTLDLDIVHNTDAENVNRLLAALESIHARYRTHPHLSPATRLISPGQRLLMTRFGPFDVLGSIGRSYGYRDLLPHTTELDLGHGLRVRVLDLEMQIVVKEEVAGEKDKAVLPLLRRTLEEKRRFRPATSNG